MCCFMCSLFYALFCSSMYSVALSLGKLGALMLFDQVNRCLAKLITY